MDTVTSCLLVVYAKNSPDGEQHSQIILSTSRDECFKVLNQMEGDGLIIASYNIYYYNSSEGESEEELLESNYLKTEYELDM